MLADLAAAIDSCWKRASAPDNVNLNASECGRIEGDSVVVDYAKNGHPRRPFHLPLGRVVSSPSHPSSAELASPNRVGRKNHKAEWFGTVKGVVLSPPSPGATPGSGSLKARFSFTDGVSATADFFRSSF
jgi:hypothetical protein